MITIDKSVYLAKGSIVTGDVTIGRDCGVWYNAVIRGDEAPIFIGDRSNVQDNAVVHDIFIDHFYVCPGSSCHRA